MSDSPSRVVPDYRTDDFRPRGSDVLVAVFVINEGEKVRGQLRRMQPYTDDLDVIVADGGSTDGSLDEQFLREVGVRALLTKTGPGKLSAQMRMAFAWALEQGYAGVIAIDGNGKDGIEALPEFARLLREGYDHVQGSRFIPGGRAVNTPLSRLIGLRVLHAPLISLASGIRQTDTTNGFRGYSAALLGDPVVDVFRDVFQTYELHYHLAIEAGRNSHFRTIETPVSRTYPRGKVPTKISPVRGNAHVLGVLFRAAAGAYRSPLAKDKLS
ncbi:glycosyltransferase family 2 protein [Microbacterium sp. NPDC006705]|uniref:glycosyltransferase family 2 protein n=1 Tax=Microbacterium sp. NPDC006705 TaxID=3364181 RepID=UPI00384D93CB